MNENESKRVSRRQFVKTSAVAAAALSGFSQMQTATAAAPKVWGKGKMKVGIIGSGWRGTQAAQNAAEGDGGLDVVAIADLYQDRPTTPAAASRKKASRWIRKTSISASTPTRKCLPVMRTT